MVGGSPPGSSRQPHWPPLLCVAALVAATAAVATPVPAAPAPPACVVSAGGRSFDLAELGGGGGGGAFALRQRSREPESYDWLYSFSACNEVKATRACQQAPPQAAAIQETSGGCYSLGNSATRLVTATASGVLVSFSGGDGGRSTTITVECADVHFPHLVRWAHGIAPLTYTALVRSRAGCPLDCARSLDGAVCGGAANGACISGQHNESSARCICARGRIGSACSEHITGVPDHVSGLSLMFFVFVVSSIILICILSMCMLRACFVQGRNISVVLVAAVFSLFFLSMNDVFREAPLSNIGISQHSVTVNPTTSQCSVTAGANTFNLAELSGEMAVLHTNSDIKDVKTKLDWRGGTFYFSACGNVTPASLPGSCAATAPSAVLHETKNGCISLGVSDTRTAAATRSGLALTYTGGRHCGAASSSGSTTIVIECANVPRPTVVRWSDGEAPCSHVALIGSQSGCVAGVKASYMGPLISGTPSPLFFATHSMWGYSDVVLDEYWILSDIVFRATNRVLVPVSHELTMEDALASADVILIGVFDGRASALSVVRKYRTSALTVFMGTENTDWTAKDFSDQLVGEVAISLGHRREYPAVPPGNPYLHLPMWLPYTVRREIGACELPRVLFAEPDAAAWIARPGFTALISSHDAYPRRLLFDLAMRLGRVDAPGPAFHNAEWPALLPANHYLRGKIEYLKGYRFNICPENSRSSGAGGWNTEKLMQAHIAGVVPIYWGDAVDTDVMNPARIIVFNDTNSDLVLETIRRLQEDEPFRAAWFAQPILAPTAGAWLEAWCDEAARLFREGAERVLQK